MPIKNWMSWEQGVDLVAATAGNLPMPNLIFHVASMVHTPVGSAPSGMILFQPNPASQPTIMGFISTNLDVAAYFGPHIFAGTPFENAPTLLAKIEVATSGDTATARITIANNLFETRLTGLRALEQVNREPSGMPPFFQQALEAPASAATLSLNGVNIPFTLPPIGISGGAPAVWSPAGIYSR